MLEVVVAVALFGATVTVLLALMPGLSRHARQSVDQMTAQRLADALQVELGRRAAGNFSALLAQLPEASDQPGMVLVADRDGTQFWESSSREVDAFFRLECWRMADASFRSDRASGFLAVAVRVHWPHDPAAETRSDRLHFVVSLHR